MQYVYFFRENYSDFVKIGKTSNEVRQRFRDFKIYAPLGAYIVGFIKTSNCHKLEKELHQFYKDKRVKGEFFKLTDEEVNLKINEYDPSKGELLSLINQLIIEYDCTELDIKTALTSYLRKLEKKEEVKINPILLEFIKNNKGIDLTATEICERLRVLGYDTNPYHLGNILKSQLGYERKSKRRGKEVNGYYKF
jgi:hypothetical protein